MPTPSTADGSNSNTAASACHQPSQPDAPLPRHHAHANTASISTLRWVGTEKPASTAYSSAPANPPASTHSRGLAGTSGSRCNDSLTSQPNNTATIVTCSPEMLTRCVSPNGRNACHSSGRSADCSPMLKARIRPRPSEKSCPPVCTPCQRRLTASRQTAIPPPPASSRTRSLPTEPIPPMPLDKAHASRFSPRRLTSPTTGLTRADTRHLLPTGQSRRR